MRTKRVILTISVIAAIAAMVALSGCTTPEKMKETLSGKDIFDPAKFSMATYLSASSADNTTSQFMVIASPKEDGGDRLTSIEVTNIGSQRADIWLNKAKDRTNRIRITSITPQSLESEDIDVPINLTVIDQTWNTLESKYVLLGYQNVTVPAGEFNDCAVYGSNKLLDVNGSRLNLTVVYYMHPSSSVPVFYMAKLPYDTILYGLQSVYGPGDEDSAPERTIESYMDLLDAGQFTEASQLLAKLDKDGDVHRLSRQDVLLLNDNMAQTYGENGPLRVQYVLVDTVQPVGKAGGYTAAKAHWTSVQYMPSIQRTLLIEKNFTLVDMNGHWKIIADDL